jgi:hypothetical protein
MILLAKLQHGSEQVLQSLHNLHCHTMAMPSMAPMGRKHASHGASCAGCGRDDSFMHVMRETQR